jgi:hypothetical protein
MISSNTRIEKINILTEDLFESNNRDIDEVVSIWMYVCLNSIYIILIQYCINSICVLI